ncbi:hypothetical protein WMF20_35510 [Sorangium sp. So ce834]|uniref:hypothetical protein n=1 Tax=Sorangium sp. So ce834 TaxID=3133321 RepID=UPI003F61C2BC
MSARELSLKAGLAPGHVGAMIRTLGDRVAFTTIAKVADAAGVSALWLARGEGSPKEPAVHRADPPPDQTACPMMAHPMWPTLRRMAVTANPGIEAYVDRAGLSVIVDRDDFIEPADVVSLAHFYHRLELRMQATEIVDAPKNEPSLADRFRLFVASEMTDYLNKGHGAPLAGSEDREQWEHMRLRSLSALLELIAPKDAFGGAPEAAAGEAREHPPQKKAKQK